MKPILIMNYPFPKKWIASISLQSHFDLVFVKNRKQLLKKISKADALITLLTEKIDKELLSKAKKLKAIGNYAVGVDNIDLKLCSEKKIIVLNTPDVLTNATAELTLGLFLATARRFTEGSEHCIKKKFKRWSPELLLGKEIADSSVVLVGKGRIGQSVAKKLTALGAQVKFITKTTSLKTQAVLLKNADFLSLHLPYNKNNHHWLNKKKLSLLSEKAIVINTSRGPLIDEKALIWALQNKDIFAAGLDVFENEPRIPNSLLKLKNVFLLPHLGSATELTRYNMFYLVARGVVALFSGQLPTNRVTLNSNSGRPKGT